MALIRREATTERGKAIVGFPRFTEEAEFSAGSADPRYPAVQLGRLPLSYPWRSADRSEPGTLIKAVLPKPRRVSLVVVGPHNLSSAGRLVVRGWYDWQATELAWSLGPVQARPKVFGEADVDWDGGNFWDRTYSDEESEGFPWYRPILVPAPQYVRAVTVQPLDPLNPAGFLESGGVELAVALQLPYNVQRGAQYGYLERTERQVADGGTGYARMRPEPRTFAGSVPFMPRATAITQFLRLQRQHSTAVPFFWWPFPNQPEFLLDTAFMARFSRLESLSLAGPLHDGVPLPLEEEM